MSEAAEGAFVLRAGEGRRIDLGAFEMSVKASAEETGGMFSLLEADEPPGFGPSLHIHHNAAEAFYVLEGEYLMFLDGREVSCPAGSFIFIPAGMQHGFRVGSVASRKLNLYTPAAMVGYFDDLSDATRTGRGTMRHYRPSRSGTRWRSLGPYQRDTFEAIAHDRRGESPARTPALRRPDPPVQVSNQVREIVVHP
jgi:mannose-6-phosphate isomerase-like protein (cupin superfamily)